MFSILYCLASVVIALVEGHGVFIVLAQTASSYVSRAFLFVAAVCSTGHGLEGWP